MFNIKFERTICDQEFGNYILSSIEIGDFKEFIRIPINYWSSTEYKMSWRNSISEGMGNNSHSALLVSAGENNKTNFLEAWVLYFGQGDIVYIQNKIIFCEEYDNFNIDNINDHVGNRSQFSEDGDKISEWAVSISDIINFYTSLNN